MVKEEEEEGESRKVYNAKKRAFISYSDEEKALLSKQVFFALPQNKYRKLNKVCNEISPKSNNFV